MFIDLDDYARAAGYLGWTTGRRHRPADAEPASAVADRDGDRIAVRAALANLICALIDWTERADGGNHLLKSGECGGCDRHPIAVSDTAFDHSWSVDVDVHGSANRDTAATRHDMPAHVARVWNHYGFAWGNDHRGLNGDWMHFEFIGTPVEAVELAHAALRELAPGTMRRGNTGASVVALQERLNQDRPGAVLVDRNFGTATEEAVRTLQRNWRLPVTGIVDTDTLAALQLG